jgi:phosphoglycerate dehydrogenase-like enzyme
MTRKRFFVTHYLRRAAIEILSDEVEVVYALPVEQRCRLGEPDADGSRQRAIAAAVEKELPAAHVLHTIGKVDRAMLAAASQLQLIVVPSSGYDNVDIEAATELALPVVHAAGAAYEPVAEHVIGIMLSLTKWIAQTDRHAHANRRGQSNRAMLLSDVPTPSTLWAKTLGIVGLGFVGRSLAQKCRDAFDMTVVAHDPFADADEATRLEVRLTDLSDLLSISDFVSINAPLTPLTAGMIGAGQLALMKPSAVLINTARGPLVDTDALVVALRDGVIAGAGLDVTEPEPLPDGHPLFDLDSVVLTPHIAGIAAEFLARNAASTARDSLAVLAGRSGARLVNPEVWPRYLAERFAP